MKNLITRNGLHRVDFLETEPLQECSSCRDGICATPEACFRPIADLQPIQRRLFTRKPRLLPATPEGWARVLGAALGIATVVLFAQGVIRHFF